MKRPELQNITIAQLLKRSCATYPDVKALIDDEEQYTYAELDHLTDRLAIGLLENGVSENDIVGLFCNTGIRGVIYFYALQKINARVMFLPEMVHDEELRNYADFPEMQTIVCDHPHFEHFGSFALIACRKRHFLTTDDSSGEWKGISELVQIHSDIDINRIINHGKPENTATMLFTSGSTGKPKVVCGSGFSKVNIGIQQSYDMRYSSDDVVIGALPMHHCFSQSVNILGAMASGIPLYIPRDRHSATIIRGIREYHCTILSAVPALYQAILRNISADRTGIRLRIGVIGGAPYSPQQFCEIEEGFAPSFTLMCSLGMTEGSAGVTICEPDDDLEIRSTTLGHFMAFLEGKIVNPATGEECEPGEAGEICFRGYNVMQGYYQNPEATRTAIDSEGFLHSGDLGSMDENGYIRLSGRLKEIIIRNGENISPGEIENVIFEDPRVVNCKVIGIEDSHYGEVICACVVVNAPMAEEEVKSLVSKKLISYKVPSYVLFFSDFPLNSTGKIDAIKLRTTAKEEIEKK